MALIYLWNMTALPHISNRSGPHAPTENTLDSFVRQEILPILSQVETEKTSKQGSISNLKLPVFIDFVLFIGLFLTVQWLLPNNGIGEVLTFVAFPLLFLLSLAITALCFRNLLADLFLRSKDRFLIRTEVLSKLSKYLGLHYTPTPSGISPALKSIASWRVCPQSIKDFFHHLNKYEKFDDVTEIVRASGLAMPREIVLGSDATREKYYQHQVKAQQFEDGFRGIYGNISFAAVEWAETRDETTTHHLIINLELPHRLTGRVEFKSKDANWPARVPNRAPEKVELISKAFSKKYEVRATDQMEARLIFDPNVIEKLTAFGTSLSGVAFDNHLVIDIVGDNRFDIVNVLTGEWSQTSIQTTLDDFSKLFEIVQSVSNTFSIKDVARA